MMKENIIVNKSFDFAIRIVKYCETLYEKKQFIIANQLMRCGTSIGSNVFEAQHAESRADFIHKLKIASKEAGETLFWLSLCNKLDNFENPAEIMKDLDQCSAILGKIIVSSKKNQI
jgi:four helix bundle protein